MKFWINPTPLQVAVKQLEEAKVNRLVYQSTAEYAVAMAAMLDKRIGRLEREVKGMSEEPPPQRQARFLTSEPDEHAQL